MENNGWVKVVNADVMRITRTVSEIQKTQEILVRENVRYKYDLL